VETAQTELLDKGLQGVTALVVHRNIAAAAAVVKAV
jgi:hypothetical protein